MPPSPLAGEGKCEGARFRASATSARIFPALQRRLRAVPRPLTPARVGAGGQKKKAACEFVDLYTSKVMLGGGEAGLATIGG
jgi:hypothetical protein